MNKGQNMWKDVGVYLFGMDGHVNEWSNGVLQARINKLNCSQWLIRGSLLRGIYKNIGIYLNNINNNLLYRYIYISKCLFWFDIEVGIP